LISGFGGVGASSSHRKIGRLSGGELAVPFLRSKRALSLMTMLPEVCELAQQVAWKEDVAFDRGGQGVVRFSGEKRSAV
jgi:hypothetical protein